MYNQRYAFFARPRKFGKSLTLDVAGQMLAAGPLPQGVLPWRGYAPVDVDAEFGGLAVHARLLNNDPSLRDLLRVPRFIIQLELGGAQTGAKLEATIKGCIALIAGEAFGGDLKAEVLQMPTPDSALRALVLAVPTSISVAVLIDEYDAAIIQDVVEGDWAAARDGIKAIRSLLMATKAKSVSGRIERCLVTGVASFARTSLFSGANNFRDFTYSPLITAAVGFSEEEIRASFPTELVKLARHLGTSVDGAVSKLAERYNGYCFDGRTTCYNPFPVLSALQAGRFTEREMDAASGTNWLGLKPASVVDGLFDELSKPISTPAAAVTRLDIVDLQSQNVHVVPLLLQTGLLTFVPGQALEEADSVLCVPPNAYARQSIARMLETALPSSAVSSVITRMSLAVQTRNHSDFTAAAIHLLEAVPNIIIKKGTPRESPFQAALFAALYACTPPSIATVTVEMASQRGSADVTVRFVGGGTIPDAAWVFEVGLGSGAKARAAKVAQAQSYARAIDAAEVLCCAVLVSEIRASASVSATDDSDSNGSAFQFVWTRRVASYPDQKWEDVTHADASLLGDIQGVSMAASVAAATKS